MTLFIVGVIFIMVGIIVALIGAANQEVGPVLFGLMLVLASVGYIYAAGYTTGNDSGTDSICKKIDPAAVYEKGDCVVKETKKLTGETSK